MNRIKRLTQSYARHIAVPWQHDTAAAQRVIFCVHHETEELRLRARIDEFELATREARHEWACFDLTDTFAVWLAAQRYARRYYQQPHLLHPLLPRYLLHIESAFDNFIANCDAGANHVVALCGVGSLFGLLKVREVVDRLAPRVPGRLLVFFPGSYENDNYRLLDGYDGWNYLAVPITADQ